MPYAAAGNIMWSVMWAVPTEDGIRIVEKWCDTDLDEAIRIHDMARRAGKKMLTLRSCNAGFPPPEKYQKVELVNEGTAREPKWRRVLVRMEKVNDKGIFWCPYCRQFRRFNRQPGSFAEGVFVPDDTRGGGLFCNMCGVSYRDFHVRIWNPRCARMYDGRRTRKRRTRSGTSTNARGRRNARGASR